MEKKLNLLIFKFALALGGGERFSFLLAKKMQELGHRVVFYTNNRTLLKKVESEGVESKKIYWGQEVGARRYLVEYFILLPFNIIRFSLIFIFNKKNSYKNIVVFQNLNEKLFATRLARFFGFHVFWVEHLSVYPWLEKSLFKKRYLKISEKIDKLIVVSNLIKDELEAMGVDHKKIKVVYNGVDLNEFKVLDSLTVENNKKKFGFFKESKIVGYVGRLHEEKGLDILLTSFQQLTKRFDHLYLLIVGDGKERVKLEERVKKLSLEKKVLFLGYQSDIPLFLNMVDVFVLPSKIRESFGMVLAEAMACGKVVVGSNLGGIPEIIKNEYNGFLFEPGNEKDLSDKLSRILSDEKLRNDISTHALKSVSDKFSIEIMIKTLEEEFKK